MKKQSLPKNRTRKPDTNNEVLTIFIDGAGARPDGAGSGIAWICMNTNVSTLERADGLAHHQAEYRSFLSAIDALPDRCSVRFFSDSLVLCCQFSGQYKVKDPELSRLLAEVRSAIARKRLQISLQWVPRAQNEAGKLL